MKLITKSIQQGVSLAYISLLTNCTDLLTNPLSTSIGEIDKDLKNIIQDTNKIFLSLDSLIGGDLKSRNNHIQTLQSHHTILEHKYQALNGYSRELNHLAIQLEEQYHLQTTPLESVEGINYHQFIHEALDFIASSKTEKEKTYKTQEIIRLIPMRMTKDSFINYIESSLKKISSGKEKTNNTLFLSIFKQLFDGRLAPSYNETFSDLAMALEAIREKAETEPDADEIETIFDDIYLLKDTIEELHNLLAVLHKANSEISVLFILDHLTFELLCQEHIAFKDLFFTVKSLLNENEHEKNEDILLETLPARLASIHAEVNDNYNNYLEKLDNEFNKNSLPETEETVEAVKLFGLIRFYLLLNIEDAFSYHEKKDQDMGLSETTVNGALLFLKQQLESLSPTERKLRMQSLIGMLPLIMNEEEFAIYFNDALENTSNKIKKVHVLAKISSFMESCGYFE